MGTVDSIENFAINIRDKLPRFGKQQEQPECLSGKVRFLVLVHHHFQHGSIAYTFLSPAAVAGQPLTGCPRCEAELAG